ncbi:MAG: dCTP deaminase domain-containing protein [Candidatus Woesearchaeota archaeon]
MIKNYQKENIGPCKYSFRLGELYKHKKIDCVDLSKDKVPELKKLKLPYTLKPGEYVIGKTIEEFDTPIDLMSFYSMSSRAIRIGLNIMCGINDPGYKGNAIFGIHNVSNNKIKLFKGMKLLQTLFSDLQGNAIPIKTKFMGGKIL